MLEEGGPFLRHVVFKPDLVWGYDYRVGTELSSRVPRIDTGVISSIVDTRLWGYKP